jgi:CMP-N,N'-diacetyllegionaminic acid synthase
MLCVIPARGGSKRIPNKNIAIVAGKPMLAWTIEAALGAGLDPIVSTESEEIGHVAALYGAKWLRRPLALSADNSSTEDALIHAYDACNGNGDMVMCLPPTSPCRTAETIAKVLNAYRGDEIDCVMTITAYHGDLWSQRGFLLERINKGAPRRQQDRVPQWEENSAVYLTRASSLWMTRSVLGYGNVFGVPVSREEGLDVNDPLDLRIADMILTDRMQQQPSSL